jgi:hypothetical protein
MDVRRVPGTALANDRTGAVVYTPPEGETRLRDLLSNWERWLHDHGDIDPLIALAVQLRIPTMPPPYSDLMPPPHSGMMPPPSEGVL